MNRWLCLLGLTIAVGVQAADDSALRVVESCQARLDPRADAGIERIEKRCPELLPALATAPWRQMLPPALRERREEITAGSLRALVELVRHSGDGVAQREAPNRATLAPVLKELGAAGQQGATRWERFKRWLKDKLDKRKDDDAGVLEKWGRLFQTSEGIAQAITYVGYALVGLLVLYVIGSELRAAGLFGGFRRAAMRTGPAAQWRRRLLLADVTAAPLADRPGMLLRLLGEALTRSGRLPAADGLTAAAIARRAELDSDEDRTELALVAASAESIRYGNRKPPDETLEGTVSTARRLLEKFARLAAGGR
jgi:hypothetical protein